MEFRVLGAFEVRDAGGRVVALGGAKRRGVAALLVVNGGRPCSLEVLVESLWTDASNVGAARTVRTYVSQLRQRFGLPIETTSAGYVLPAENASVDAVRFADLVRAARRDDDLATRAALLGDALALWRGPALGEFLGSRWADEPARSWERLRREVTHERARARLAVGDDAAVIPDLEMLVGEQPLDEQLTADLMLACYRAGRQADALREHGRLRRRLAEELGVDPSAELVELERRILDHDPSLDWQAPAGGQHSPAFAAVEPLPEGVVQFTPSDVEGRLPTTAVAGLGRPNTFVGRADALDELARQLAIPGFVTITGPGGIGKTRLMQETVGRVRGRFSKTTVVFLADVRDETGLEDALQTSLSPDRTSPFASTTSVGSLDFTAELVRGLVGRQLVALDNCEQVREPLTEILNQVIARCPDLTILATSREPLHAVAERVLALGPLELPVPTGEGDVDQVTEVESMQLLRSRARESGADLRIDLKTATQLTEICRRLEGIPLALELAAARLVTTSPGDLLARMARQLRLLAANDRRDARHRTLHDTIDWSYQLLDAAERDLLRRLGIFVGGFTLDAAEYVCADASLSSDDVYLGLCELVAKSLVMFDNRVARYRLLEPIRIFAFEHLDEAGQHDVIARQHARWVQGAARNAVRTQVGGGGPPDAFAAELENTFEALRWSFQNGDHETLFRIVAALGYTWHSTDWRRGRIWAQRAVELSHGASPGLRAAVLLSRGIVEQRASLEGSAPWLEESRSLFAEVGDNGSLAWATFFLARAWTVSDMSVRHELLHEARRLFRETGQPVGEGWALVNLGINANFGGDLEQARTDLQQALDVSVVVGDATMLGVVLEDLGRNALLRGDTTAAQNLFRRAVETQRSSGDRFNLTSLLHGAGWTELMAGDLDAAAALVREGIGLSIDIDNEWELRCGLLVLAVILSRRGDAARARALAAATGLGSAERTGETWQKNWLAVQAVDALAAGAVVLLDSEVPASGTAELYAIGRREASAITTVATDRAPG